MILKLTGDRYEYTWSAAGNNHHHNFSGRFVSFSDLRGIKKLERLGVSWGYPIGCLSNNYKKLLHTMVTPLG